MSESYALNYNWNINAYVTSPFGQVAQLNPIETISGKTEGENESNAATSVDWWQESKEMMLDWFRCNPLRLGISADSVKFVQGQIELGEKNKNNILESIASC